MRNQFFRFSILCVALVFVSVTLTNLSYALSVSKDEVVAVWLFDEGKGETIKDSSGNGNKGILIGDYKIDKPSEEIPIRRKTEPKISETDSEDGAI